MKFINMAAVAFAIVPATLAGAFECSHVLARSKCFEAVASSVSKTGGGGVSVGGVYIGNRNPEDCPKLKDACATMYNETNGKKGYQAPDPTANPPEPGDEMVDQKCGSVAVPSNNLTIGSFTNTNTQGKTATHWELSATDENDGKNEFSGTF